MSRFLYYLPHDQPTCPKSLLAERGLPHVADCELTPRAVLGSGPDGGRGTIWGPDDVGFHADRQTWHLVRGHQAWIGWEGDPPRPIDVARREMLQGHAVVLGDGYAWQVPVAKSFDADYGLRRALPCRVARDDEGAWCPAEVEPRYTALWEAACRAYDDICSESGGRILSDFGAVCDDAVTVLAANYVVGPDEVERLGLLTERNVMEILKAAIDYPTVVAWSEQKKTESAGSATDAGPGA